VPSLVAVFSAFTANFALDVPAAFCFSCTLPSSSLLRGDFTGLERRPEGLKRWMKMKIDQDFL
jgi:hypothetical protein